MRFQVAVALLATAFACLVASSTGQGDERKCARAFPLPPWKSSYRTGCTYLCREWPFRYENEPDGIHCGALAAFIKTHVCRDGKCVKAENVQTTAADEEYFSTSPSTKH
ncbi:uncharacterized protein LOC119389077 [Rhipicephalus sanguineus]|uniref:uncharacterized protein LOC119389077 n=1 Tax=Rhipicephalus sanguineus TaxID=34632 RepID=UPI0020C329DC|nr:uncharacterized protein LOC119389077 [Rhipicephalus sanguineus]